MSERSLEERVTALEQVVAELRQKLAQARPNKNWLQRLPPLTPEQLRAHEEAAEYGRYFRKTGQQPPPDWKPGDPIPGPDWWEPERPT